MGWIQRKTRMVIVAIGCSLGLFGCVAMEGTTTVLEDGRVIERVQLSPKRSLWAVLALMADNFAIDLKSDALSRGEASDIVSELRRGMEDMCVMADFLFEQPYADLSIPVSTTRMPLEFEIAGAMRTGARSRSDHTIREPCRRLLPQCWVCAWSFSRAPTIHTG